MFKKLTRNMISMILPSFQAIFIRKISNSLPLLPNSREKTLLSNAITLNAYSILLAKKYKSKQTNKKLY